MMVTPVLNLNVSAYSIEWETEEEITDEEEDNSNWSDDKENYPKSKTKAAKVRITPQLSFELSSFCHLQIVN